MPGTEEKDYSPFFFFSFLRFRSIFLFSMELVCTSTLTPPPQPDHRIDIARIGRFSESRLSWKRNQSIQQRKKKTIGNRKAKQSAKQRKHKGH